MSGTISLTPQASISLLQPTKFQVQFNRIPDVVYFCQKAPLPASKIPTATHEMPFKSRKAAGSKIEYDDWNIQFLVEEALNTWNEIHQWMRDYTTETGYQDYNNLNRLTKSSLIQRVSGFPDAYCDATLTVLSTQNNPISKFVFHDCFPVYLGELDFDTTSGAENTIHCDATFAFWYYERVVL